MASIKAPPIRRLVFWQNLNSHHQAPYLEELSRLGLFEVHWAVEKDVASSGRAAMGWPRTPISFPLHIDPDEGQMRALLEDRPAQSLHIFTSIFGEPFVRKAHKRALESGSRLALMNEPPMPAAIHREEYGAGVLKTTLRPLAHKTHRIAYGSRVEAVWAIGHMGVEWYRKLGYPDGRIFPWAYFPPKPEGESVERRLDAGETQLAYLGQATARKGVDLMIETLGRLRNEPWHLRFVGEGPLLARCRELAQNAGIDERIEWLGFRPHDEAMAIVASSDLVLVPSRHDGWGAVVNESLMRGTPVIATDRCGAADFVQTRDGGRVVRAGSPDALQDALAPALLPSFRDTNARTRLQKWSRRIAPESGASYFASTVRYLNGEPSKPTPPWLEDTQLA